MPQMAKDVFMAALSPRAVLQSSRIFPRKAHWGARKRDPKDFIKHVGLSWESIRQGEQKVTIWPESIPI
jgi:hypothetical protein